MKKVFEIINTDSFGFNDLSSIITLDFGQSKNQQFVSTANNGNLFNVVMDVICV